MSILSANILATKADSVRRQKDRPDQPVWQSAMRAAIRNVGELRARLQLPAIVDESAKQAADQFSVFVPEEFLKRIEPGNPLDPLLLQVLPVASEAEVHTGYSIDPLQEAASSHDGGLIKKYHGRALLVTTAACPVHCRYCFRRHFAYEEIPQGRAQWEPLLEQLVGMNDVDEVLLSGGDPLSLGDDLLGWLLQRLAAIPHLQRVRFHTRFPIMIPQRVNDSLLKIVGQSRLTTLFVVHCNHANEIDSAVKGAFERLVSAGIPVLNQTVLLKGVNDSVDSLEHLCRKLINNRVMPYYLHQLDRVAGAAHFDVSEEDGRHLIKALRKLLPGYAVPRFVREEPGEPAKTVLL